VFAVGRKLIIGYPKVLLMFNRWIFRTRI